MTTIEGRLDDRPIYHDVSKFSDSGNKYLISKFSVDRPPADGDIPPLGLDNSIVVKGEMNSPVYGWKYRLHGQWKSGDRGTTFDFSSFEPVLPTSSSGLIDYLSRYVPALGTFRARLLVDRFGDETLNILRSDPLRIAEIEGIGDKTAARVAKFFESEIGHEVDGAAYSRLYDLLSAVRPPRRVIESILKIMGSNAEQFIRENPYRLLAYPGMGWDRVDLLAIETIKYDRNGLPRHKAAIREIMDRNISNGHTKMNYEELVCDASDLIKCKLRADAVESMIDGMDLVRDGDWIMDQSLDEAERGIVRHIGRLQRSFRPLVWITPLTGLDEQQAAIVPVLRDNAVCILSGVPGSGKSYVTSVLIKSLIEFGVDDMDIIVVAPTGKAAKRSQEFLAQQIPGQHIPCMTIHRSLGCRRSREEPGIPEDVCKIHRGREGYEFIHGESDQFEYKIVVCDETSMCDVLIFYRLIQSIPDGGRLLIVGDHNQLPSVGPGATLRDMIGLVPGVVLEKPRRNSGSIFESCWQIKVGQMPHPGLLSRRAAEDGFKDNWIHREIVGDENILNFIKNLHLNYIKQYGVDMLKEKMQVISPEKKGVVGCHSLNATLREIVTPPSEEFALDSGDGEIGGIRKGDKVVSTKNRHEEIMLPVDVTMDELSLVFGSIQAKEMMAEGWREDAWTVHFGGKDYLVPAEDYMCYLVNGDMGEAIGIYGSGRSKRLIVRFNDPDRVCMLKPGESHVIIAYAMTCHKCQGSGFEIVVMPLTDFYWNPKTKSGIWTRELVYTAFSRPTERLITVGRLSCLHDAVGRQTVDRRRTRLRELMEASTNAV